MSTDFEAYWSVVDKELAALPARPVLDPAPARSTEAFDCYQVRLTSIGPYRIFGYLSVPRGDGPFPALLETPRYGSVVQPPHYHDRLRYLVFTPVHRGQRLADSPYAADFPGMLTDDIATPESYVYRGVVADCLRAAEFLRGMANVDPSRIAVSGDDLALITAARRPGFTAVRITGGLFYRMLERCARIATYPLEELNDHLRARPDDEPAVRNTLAYFDPLRHAPAVRAGTLVAMDGEPDWYAPLLAALPSAEGYRLTHADAVDDNTLDEWLAGRLGVPPMPRFLRRVPV